MGTFTNTTTWPRKRQVAVACAFLIVVASIASAWLVDSEAGLRPASNEYNLAAWETRHIANKWLYEGASIFRDEPPVAEQNERILRFFALTNEIDALETEVSDNSQRGEGGDDGRSERLMAALKERDRIENQVESTIEGRIGAVVRDEGLTRSLPLLPGVVWPPVDFEFTRAPHTLVTSRRDRIELIESVLLREDFALADIERIEEARERKDNVSALAFRTSGVAAYPTIVDHTAGYRRLLELVAHEWTHTYLAFSPLGFNYYDSYDLRSMNETVADLIGRELAEGVMQRWPLPEASPPRTRETPPARIDLAAELRKLRTEVDALLAGGAIEEAERLMEERRQELVDQGAQIRKLNQAFFAFTNLYAGEAGNPAATNPIGPKIDEVRRRSSSLEEFVRTISRITSVAALDRELRTLDSVK